MNTLDRLGLTLLCLTANILLLNSQTYSILSDTSLIEHDFATDLEIKNDTLYLSAIRGDINTLEFYTNIYKCPISRPEELQKQTFSTECLNQESLVFKGDSLLVSFKEKDQIIKSYFCDNSLSIIDSIHFEVHDSLNVTLEGAKLFGNSLVHYGRAQVNNSTDVPGYVHELDLNTLEQQTGFLRDRNWNKITNLYKSNEEEYLCSYEASNGIGSGGWPRYNFGYFNLQNNEVVKKTLEVYPTELNGCLFQINESQRKVFPYRDSNTDFDWWFTEGKISRHTIQGFNVNDDSIWTYNMLFDTLNSSYIRESLVYDIYPCNNGDFIISGRLQETPLWEANPKYYHGYILRLDQNGNEVFLKSYRYKNEEGVEFDSSIKLVKEDEQGNLIALGTINDTFNLQTDLWLMRLDENGCLEEDVNCSTQSISETVAESTIALYPNPAASHISIDTKESIAYYTLINRRGDIIMKDEFNTTINIAELSSGLYFINFYTAANQTITKALSKY